MKNENDIDNANNNTPLSPTSRVEKCLKTFEVNFISKILEQTKNIKRDINMKNNHPNLLQRRLNKKANELQTREGQLKLAQQELEVKALELLNQLEYKDEEINYIKDRFSEERTQLKAEIDNLNKIVLQKNKRIKELERKLTTSNSPNDKATKENYEKLQRENNKLKQFINEQNKLLITLKKSINKEKIKFTKEKEEILFKRIEQLEKDNKELAKCNSCYNITQVNELNSIVNKLIEQNMKEKKVFEFKVNKHKYEKKKTVESLLKEKEFLISNCKYSSNDPLIIKLDAKIEKYKQKDAQDN